MLQEVWKGALEILCVINIYEPHKVVDRIHMLNTLRRMNEEFPYPHTIIGAYFNMILDLSEKKGDLRRLDRDAKAFRKSLDLMEMVDV